MAQWKHHEREVAKYFGTQRRLRGADFSQSDVEVFVDAYDWLGIGNEFFLVVECKYSTAGHGLIPKFYTRYREFHKNNDYAFACPIGNCILMDLQDLKSYMQNIVLGKGFIPPSTMYFNDTMSHLQVPKYIEDYLAQARDYSTAIKVTKPVLPLVCMAKRNQKGRLVVMSITDLCKLKDQLNVSSSPL